MARAASRNCIGWDDKKEMKLEGGAKHIERGHSAAPICGSECDMLGEAGATENFREFISFCEMSGRAREVISLSFELGF
jgi:hypothetical protein